MAKTIKLGNFAAFDDANFTTAASTVSAALAHLEADAVGQGREVLWGTLEVEMENNQIEDVQLASNVTRIHSSSRVVVSALAVLK